MSTQTRAFIRGKISLHKIKTVDAKCYNFKTLVEVTLGFGKSINQYLIMYKIWQIVNRFVGTFLSSNFPKIGRSVYTQQYIFSIPTLINTLPGHVVLIIWLNYMFLMPMFGCNLKIKKQATNSAVRRPQKPQKLLHYLPVLFTHIVLKYFKECTLFWKSYSLIYRYIMKNEANKINVALFLKKYCKQCILALNRKWQ